MQYVSDLSVFLRDVLSAAVVTAIVVALIKPALELKVKPSAPLHDILIRWLAILIGVLLYGGVALATGRPWSGAFAILALINGAIIGLTSVGAYHLLTTSGPLDSSAFATITGLGPNAPSAPNTPPGGPTAPQTSAPPVVAPTPLPVGPLAPDGLPASSPAVRAAGGPVPHAQPHAPIPAARTVTATRRAPRIVEVHEVQQEAAPNPAHIPMAE